MSQPFRAAGSAPQPVITSPSRARGARADETVYPSGQAYDDAGRFLNGRFLQWRDNGRNVGTGTHATLTALRPGRHRISLAAKDAFGRTASTSIVITVKPTKPQLVGLRLPKRLNAAARNVVIITAASVPAEVRLVGNGRRCQVAMKPVKCTFPIKPGQQPLHLILRATTGTFTTTVTRSVLRTKA